MAKDYDLRSIVLEYILIYGDHAIQEASAIFHVSISSIYRWRELYIETGSFARKATRAPKEWKGIRPDHMEYLLGLLEVNPAMYLREMVGAIFLEFDFAYTIHQVWRGLRSRNITRKVLEEHAAQQNPLLRAHFRHLLRPTHMGGAFSAETLLFGDETHLDGRNIRRRYGRSRRGCPAFVQRYNLHGDAVGCSAIATFSVRGVETVDTYAHNIDGNVFMDTLENSILPIMNPFPGIRSVLVLDNASVHLRHAITHMCQMQNIFVLFLPPYSYDFNPIEQAFHAAKAYIRRRWGNIDAQAPLAQRLTHALYASSNPTMACNCFENSHVHVSQEVRQWAINLA